MCRQYATDQSISESTQESQARATKLDSIRKCNSEGAPPALGSRSRGRPIMLGVYVRFMHAVGPVFEEVC